jgi:hypothetical protein
MFTPAGISFTKLWSDDDMVELRIEVSDGRSSFSNDVYVGHVQLRTVVAELETFKTHIYGGLYDLRFGEFGPEYASGALHARLHFQERGLLHLTVMSQSEFNDFGKKRVASEATLFLKTEPALLDNFIRAVASLSNGAEESAHLEAI